MRILSDNVTLFINTNVKEFLALYDVDHVKSTLYYPKDNGQAEASNKTLLKVLSRMVHEYHKMWSDALLVVLWAYRIFKCRLTKATPFSLVYGRETVSFTVIVVLPVRLTLDAELDNDSLRILELELI